MPKKNGAFPRRAWNLLRLVLLWARRGGVLKSRFLMELRLVPKYLKSSLDNATAPKDPRHYLEREMSFEETPIFHVKMHRPASLRFHMPRFPCIDPQVDFDYDFDLDGDREENPKGRVKNGEDDVETCGHSCVDCDDMVPCEDEGIDMKAEEFIAKFYEQMKLQRQISQLQYKETPRRLSTIFETCQIASG